MSARDRFQTFSIFCLRSVSDLPLMKAGKRKRSRGSDSVGAADAPEGGGDFRYTGKQIVAEVDFEVCFPILLY